MRTPGFQIQNIVTACQRMKVLTKKELLQAAGCSTMTAWRWLRAEGYFTSYNHNARYYTLVGIPSSMPTVSGPIARSDSANGARSPRPSWG